jgi:hypothetical protein
MVEVRIEVQTRDLELEFARNIEGQEVRLGLFSVYW